MDKFGQGGVEGVAGNHVVHWPRGHAANLGLLEYGCDLMVTFRAVQVAVFAVEGRVLILIITLTFGNSEKKHKAFYRSRPSSSK